MHLSDTDWKSFTCIIYLEKQEGDTTVPESHSHGSKEQMGSREVSVFPAGSGRDPSPERSPLSPGMKSRVKQEPEWGDALLPWETSP